MDAVAHGSTPYAGAQPSLPLAAVWGAMDEPARMTSAAHAKKRAIGLPMIDAFQTNGIAVNFFVRPIYWPPRLNSIKVFAKPAVNAHSLTCEDFMSHRRASSCTNPRL